MSVYPSLFLVWHTLRGGVGCTNLLFGKLLQKKAWNWIGPWGEKWPRDVCLYLIGHLFISSKQQEHLIQNLFTFLHPSHLSMVSWFKKRQQQECIPVGCVTPTSLAVSPARYVLHHACPPPHIRHWHAHPLPRMSPHHVHLLLQCMPFCHMHPPAMRAPLWTDKHL